jgi:hypothetical protein
MGLSKLFVCVCAADPQHYPPSHMPMLPAMSHRCFRKRVNGCDGNPKARFVNGTIEPRKFSRPSSSIVTLNPKQTTITRLGINPVRMRHSAALANKVEASLKLFAASQRQDSVDSIWGKCMKLFDSSFVASINNRVNSEFLEQLRGLAP